MKDHRSGEILTSTEQETLELARELGASLKGDEVILLYGGLGAGKTIFAKGIAAGLDIENVDMVCSPSYTLVNIYSAKFTIFHIDLYRMEKESEIEDWGWEDFLGQGILVVEWAEKLNYDAEAIHVTIEVLGDQKRKIRISPDPFL